MDISHEFLSLILDSVSENIAVINETGQIVYVNKPWLTYGLDNQCASPTNNKVENYLDICDLAAATGDEFGAVASKGIRSVISKQNSKFYFEYPCHSPEVKRWFMMRVTPFTTSQKPYFVITHQDVTERKLAEEEIENLALLDGLTNIPNRRAVDKFFNAEWHRCARFNQPICFAIIDLDHFKKLNDHYGHQYGDTSLKEVGKLLKQLTKRPSDICARYGGEEFAIVLGNTQMTQAVTLLESLLQRIIELNIPHSQSTTHEYLTASIGLAEMTAEKNITESDLIKQADIMLYKAKNAGRNTLCYDTKA